MLRVALPVAGVLLAAVLPVHAATWLVTPDGSGDFPTIQAAIAGADSGDVIELADGTYTGAGNRNFWIYNRSVTVRSASGNPAACVIDAEGGPGLAQRVFGFQATPPEFVLQDVTLTGGTALDLGSGGYGGAIRMNDLSAPTIIGCVFVGNAASRGGAIFAYSDCTPTITDCLFVDNDAVDYGGAMSMSSGSAFVVERCVFVGNTAVQGGAISNWDGSASTFTACTFVDNEATDTGGVAWCRNDAAPTFVRSILAFSPAGGSITCDSPLGAPTLSCCTVFGNVGGDWIDCIAGQEAGDGNLSVDPLFCDAASRDFRLQWGSPCLSAHSGGCGEIGAEGPGGCPSLSIDPASWGSVRGAYR